MLANNVIGLHKKSMVDQLVYAGIFTIPTPTCASALILYLSLPAVYQLHVSGQWTWSKISHSQSLNTYPS